jgi:C1A family cysteine protease
MVMLFGTGWKPSLPDHRDFKLGVIQGVTLPTKVDLRPEIDWIAYNQGTINSCTAQSAASLMRFVNKKQGLPFSNPSRMFIYWVERHMENTIDMDDGATMRSAMRVMAKYGVPDEKNWGYSKTTLYIKPPMTLYKEAVQNMVKIYMRVGRAPYELKQCLADGYPFIFGMMVFSAFNSQEVAKTGIVPLPTMQDEALGGHAVICVGYDDEKQHYIILNSWGPDWGDNGYFYLPYRFMHSQLADDFFTVRQMEGIDENRMWKAI